MRRQAKHPVLAGPFGWQVGETRNADTVNRFDETGREEGKRDRLIHFSDAAALARCDAFRGFYCISAKFIEPTASTGNRCDKDGASL